MKSDKSGDRKSETSARDPDLAGAEAAMHRAARHARRRAAEHGGSIAIYEGGEVVWVKVDGEDPL